MLPLPQAGAVLLTLKDREEQMGARHAGYRGFGDTQIRIDMVERIARGGHEAIARNERYDATSPFIVSLGLSEQLFNHVMRNAGFRPVTPKPADGPVEGVQVDLDDATVDNQEGADATVQQAAGGEPAPRPTELPPVSPPDDHPDRAPDETPVLPDDPAPQTPPDEFPPVTPVETPPPSEPTPATPPQAATPAQAEVQVEAATEAPETGVTEPGATEPAEGASATEAAPAGANWAFRGRHRPRERNFRGAGDQQSKKGRRAQGKQSGKPLRNKEGQGSPSPAGRFAPKAKQQDRPAGGGAFAGLAELLRRND